MSHITIGVVASDIYIVSPLVLLYAITGVAPRHFLNDSSAVPTFSNAGFPISNRILVASAQLCGSCFSAFSLSLSLFYMAPVVALA